VEYEPLSVEEDEKHYLLGGLIALCHGFS